MNIVNDDTLPPQVELDAMRDVTLADVAQTDDDSQTEHAPLEGPGPARLNHYVLLSKLGQGGMGIVYAAYDESLDRKVAVKLLRSGGERKAQRRLIREAQSMARLSHPNVVQIYEIGTTAQQIFIVMEFVKGVTLKRWLAAQPRSQQAILQVFGAAGEGLAAAHAEGLVHRDFKPDNVMIRDDGRVQVMDFGLARGDEPELVEGDPTIDPTLPNPLQLPHIEPSGLTATGMLMGTPAYMAPEQFEGHRTDARSDQFSFCVALWEALHGQRPFAGASLMDLSVAVCSGSVTIPAHSDVPGWLRKVVARGLELEPEARWPSLQALLAALRKDPTHRRRALLATISTMVVALAVIGGLTLSEQRAQAKLIQDCQDQSHALRWNAEVQAELAAAFEATGLRYAPAAWEHTRALLDGVAQDWTQARSDECLETRVEHQRDEESYALISACLDERRATFEGLLDAWTKLDEQMLARATSAAARLPPVSSCINERGLTLRMQAPPNIQAEVAELRARIEQAAALEFAGKYDLALAQTQPLLLDAQALGWRPLIAEVRLALGQKHHKLGDYEASRAALEQAYLDAIGANHDMVALHSASLLSVTVGDKLAQAERGLYWGELARMYVERMGLNDTLHEALVLDNVAAIHLRAGEFDQAVALHERALQITKAALGPDHLDVANALNSSGSAQWEQGNYEAARALFLESLRIKQAVLGPEHPAHGTIYNNIGAVAWADGDFDQALASFQHALAIREAALGLEHPDVAWSYNNIGAVLASQGKFEQALISFRHALAIQTATLGPDHPDTASALANIANILRSQGADQEALDTHRRVLTIFEATYGPDHPDVAKSLNNIGTALSTLGELDEATAVHQRALKIREAALGPDNPEVAMSLDNLGTVLIDNGHPDEGLAALRRGLAIREAALRPEHTDIAVSLDNLGYGLRSVGAFDEALVVHARALVINEAEFGPDGADVSRSLIGLGLAHLALGALDDAHRELERAYMICTQSEVTPTTLAETEFALAQVLWRLHRMDRMDHKQRARAHELATQARERYAAAPRGQERELEKLDAWLGANRQP